MAFLVLKTVKSPHSNSNNSLPDNSSPFHNSKVNIQKTTQISKAVDTIVEMAPSTPRDSLWRLWNVLWEISGLTSNREDAGADGTGISKREISESLLRISTSNLPMRGSIKIRLDLPNRTRRRRRTEMMAPKVKGLKTAK
jgi:hypothetical protein